MKKYFTGKNFMLLIFFSLFAALVISRFDYTWDDSAITIAFSKTLAATGDIRPSAYSDRVEGYSSFLWMLINWTFFKCGAGESAALFLSKILAALFNAATAGLLYFLIKKKTNNEIAIFTGLFTYLFSSASLFESINGMETPLYAFFLLASYAAYESGDKHRGAYYIFIICSALVILTRHEGAWYLVPFVILEFQKNGAGALKKPHFYLWAAVFLSYNVWHYLYFDDILTNPMLAKRWTPYTPEFLNFREFLSFHITPLLFIFFDYLPLFAALVVFDRFDFSTGKPDVMYKPRLESDPALLFILAGLLFNFIIGSNWGPKGRMFLPALPFLALYFSGIFGRKEKLANFMNAFIILFCAAFFAYINVYYYVSLAPMQMQVEGFRGVWNNARIISSRAGLDKFIYAGPDMGGFLLYSENLRVIDTALLCNRHLAHKGYARFGDYIFEDETPHIIKTHAVWTFVSGIYGDERFYKMYKPVSCRGTNFFVRNDVFDNLSKKSALRRTEMPVIADEESRYAKYDRQIYNKFGICYELTGN
ncbi:MAG TPA: glycosyltransferase family 39 protein [Candidatus Wallbacteria bacterium]|nr:glycosyltransferase family 39 protein [Candidatus Wallbacteria bacterium]